MQLTQPRLQRRQPGGHGLDDDLLFALLFDLSMPSVDRRHHRQNIHACSEPFGDQRAPERHRVGVGAEGGQDNRDLGCGG